MIRRLTLVLWAGAACLPFHSKLAIAQETTTARPAAAASPAPAATAGASSQDRSASQPGRDRGAAEGERAEPAAEPIFSGPQVGEKLALFKVRGVFDAAAGKEIDFVTQAAGKPIVLVFVHEANRPSIGLTRMLTGYTASRAKDGLATGVIWLADDATEAENVLKRMRHALSPEAPIGISVDGKEGPGSYGLNRNVTLTILVGKENKVTANFALVQPSVQADLPKILEAITKVAGGPIPKLEDLPGAPVMAGPGRNEQDPRLRGVITPVIQRNASEEAVNRAAAAVEKFVAENDGMKEQVGRIARTIVESGRLSTYGTPRAQVFLRKWASEYGGLPREEEMKK